MVGPVIHTGVAGSPQYRVDHGPRMRDQQLAL